MGSIKKSLVGDLPPRTRFLTAGGRTHVVLGNTFEDRMLGIRAICDLGGNIMYAPAKLEVTAVLGDPVERDIPQILDGWQYCVN